MEKTETLEKLYWLDKPVRGENCAGYNIEPLLDELRTEGFTEISTETPPSQQFANTDSIILVCLHTNSPKFNENPGNIIEYLAHIHSGSGEFVKMKRTIGNRVALQIDVILDPDKQHLRIPIPRFNETTDFFVLCGEADNVQRKLNVILRFQKSLLDNNRDIDTSIAPGIEPSKHPVKNDIIRKPVNDNSVFAGVKRKMQRRRRTIDYLISRAYLGNFAGTHFMKNIRDDGNYPKFTVADYFVAVALAGGRLLPGYDTADNNKILRIGDHRNINYISADFALHSVFKDKSTGDKIGISEIRKWIDNDTDETEANIIIRVQAV